MHCIPAQAPILVRATCTTCDQRQVLNASDAFCSAASTLHHADRLPAVCAMTVCVCVDAVQLQFLAAQSQQKAAQYDRNHPGGQGSQHPGWHVAGCVVDDMATPQGTSTERLCAG
jgi:hypothetical protein